MKVETWLFSAGALFFAPVGIVYGFVTHWHEPLGPAALLLCTLMMGLIAIYLYLTSRRVDSRPEDDPYGQIAQGAGEQGFFSPYSWWPFWVGLGAAVTFAGLAAGWWLFFIGAGLGAIGVVGWVFEYYRGEHAH